MVKDIQNRTVSWFFNNVYNIRYILPDWQVIEEQIKLEQVYVNLHVIHGKSKFSKQFSTKKGKHCINLFMTNALTVVWLGQPLATVLLAINAHRKKITIFDFILNNLILPDHLLSSRSSTSTDSKAKLCTVFKALVQNCPVFTTRSSYTTPCTFLPSCFLLQENVLFFVTFLYLTAGWFNYKTPKQTIDCEKKCFNVVFREKEWYLI